MTISQGYKLALDRRAKWRDAKDQDTIKSVYGAVTKYWGEDRILSTITDADIQQWMGGMAKEEGKSVGTALSPSTINHRLSLLSVLMKTAKVPVPYFERRIVRKGRKRVYNPAELEQMRVWFTTSPFKGSADMADLVVVLLHTAVRLSEALRLHDRDIDLSTNLIQVWENKADHPRTLPLSTVAAGILKARRGKTGGQPFGALTVDRCGKLMVRCRKALGHADDEQFVIHSLRHTSLTMVARESKDAFKVQQFAGHKSLQTTRGYVHDDVEDIRGLVGVFGVPGSVPGNSSPAPSEP